MNDDTFNSQPPMLMTLKQAAKWVGLGPRTLYRFSKSGRAPMPIKLTPGSKSGCSRYRLADLEAWVEQGCKRWAE